MEGALDSLITIEFIEQQSRIDLKHLPSALRKWFIHKRGRDGVIS